MSASSSTSPSFSSSACVTQRQGAGVSSSTDVARQRQLAGTSTHLLGLRLPLPRALDLVPPLLGDLLQVRAVHLVALVDLAQEVLDLVLFRVELCLDVLELERERGGAVAVRIEILCGEGLGSQCPRLTTTRSSSTGRRPGTHFFERLSVLLVIPSSLAAPLRVPLRKFELVLERREVGLEILDLAAEGLCLLVARREHGELRGELRAERGVVLRSGNAKLVSGGVLV